VALKTCAHCGRKFSAARSRCPWCKRRHHGIEDGGFTRTTRFGVAAIVMLVAGSLAYNLSRETGPPAEFEALHSAAGAVEECRSGIERELAGGFVGFAGRLEAEYLGGGEYEVRSPVTVSDAGRAVTAMVLCEAQFRRETGWSTDVELES
jgi:hypothetical protein